MAGRRTIPAMQERLIGRTPCALTAPSADGGATISAVGTENHRVGAPGLFDDDPNALGPIGGDRLAPRWTPA